MSTPPPIERDTVASVVAVLTRVKESEADPGHEEILSNAISRVWERYDGERFEVSPDAVTRGDVATAYAFLDEHSPTREEAQQYRIEHREPHPNRKLAHGLDFVDAASRYDNGCLPSVRTWTATYIHDGTVIAERTYDREDAIKLNPVIDDVRYRASGTERAGDRTVKVSLVESPFRTDIDVYIHQHTNGTVTVEGHDGPNVADETGAVSALGREFDQERRDDTEIVVSEDLDDVVAFIDQQGWEYDASDDVQLPE
ncbi:MAG: hypothetical protein ABEH61_01320 [Haloarculaceae archaeon]